MWPRVVEVTLGAWLLITPFVFRDSPAIHTYATNAMISGSVVIVASLLCFWRRADRSYFVTLLVALWLIGHGYFSAERPGPAPAQNEIMVGLLLLLFAILPTETNQPPGPWRGRISAEAGSPPRRRT